MANSRQEGEESTAVTAPLVCQGGGPGGCQSFDRTRLSSFQVQNLKKAAATAPPDVEADAEVEMWISKCLIKRVFAPRQAKKLKKGAATAPLDVEADAEEEAELARMRAAGFTGGSEAAGDSLTH